MASDTIFTWKLFNFKFPQKPLKGIYKCNLKIVKNVRWFETEEILPVVVGAGEFFGTDHVVRALVYEIDHSTLPFSL